MDTRIKILENDLTTSNVTLDTTDVVYVPGFATSGEYRNPTYCGSLSEFIATFGSTIPKFSAIQNYPRYADAVTEGKTKNAATPGFVDFALDLTKADTSGNIQWFAAGDSEPSYLYAAELLTAGIPVVFERLRTTSSDGSPSVADFYGQLTVDGYITGHEDEPAIFANPKSPIGPYILDKGAYNIKYITSGGYPTFEYKGVNIPQAMCNIASCIISDETQEDTGRGDCIALIDHTNYADRVLSGQKKDTSGTVVGCSVYYQITHNADFAVTKNGSSATMFTPWHEYSLIGSYTTTTTSVSAQTAAFPGSFGYLRCIAKAIKLGNTWNAISGVSRGLVPSIGNPLTTKTLTNTIAESYQIEEGAAKEKTGYTYNVSINPITYIRPYGYCIWGNRTLLDYNPSEVGFATSFLNIRNILCDVKKQAFYAAQSLMFEQNNDVLWVNFKSLLTPLLDSMVTSTCLSSYKLLKTTSDTVAKTKLNCKIVLYPVYSVEQFTINITLSDEDVNVE